MRSEAIIEQINVMPMTSHCFESTLETGGPIYLESTIDLVEHSARQQIRVLIVIDQEHLNGRVLGDSFQWIGSHVKQSCLVSDTYRSGRKINPVSETNQLSTFCISVHRSLRKRCRMLESGVFSMRRRCHLGLLSRGRRRKGRKKMLITTDVACGLKRGIFAVINARRCSTGNRLYFSGGFSEIISLRFAWRREFRKKL